MIAPTGGPKTEEGKGVARWNATRHGIRSPAPVVPGVERKEDPVPELPEVCPKCFQKHARAHRGGGGKR